MADIIYILEELKDLYYYVEFKQCAAYFRLGKQADGELYKSKTSTSAVPALR